MASPTRRDRSHPPFGDRLRAERRARGLSLRDLAERLDMSPSLISQIETGRARPSVSTLYALANELAVSIDELLFLETDRADPRVDATPAGQLVGPAGDGRAGRTAAARRSGRARVPSSVPTTASRSGWLRGSCGSG